MLRIMVQGDRIISGISAYSKIGFETCTRLANLGYPVAHTPMAMANRMGKQSFEKILIYPSGKDYFAEDVAMDNYIDFKADLLITVKEPWVFNRIFHEAMNFVPMCVTGDTLIQTNEGTTLGLNEDLEMTKTPICYWLKKPLAYPLYSIRTRADDELHITGNNEICVLEHNRVRWKRVENLKCGELVIKNNGQSGQPINALPWDYQKTSPPQNLDKRRNRSLEKELSEDDSCRYSESPVSIQNISFYPPESNPPQASKNRKIEIFKFSRLATENDGSGMGLLSRSCRWRREHQFGNYAKETRKRGALSYGYARDNSDKYKRINGELDSGEVENVGRLSNLLIKQTLPLPYNGRIQDLSNIERNIAFSDCEEAKVSTFDRIYRDAHGKTISFKIRRGNHSFNRENPRIAELQTSEVSHVGRFITKGPVFDLTTESHNYFANNILIHNCPIDHSPVSGAIIARLTRAFKVIAVSRFGQLQLKNNNIESTYIPHGVRTDIYKPLDAETKKKCRKLFFLPEDDFIVGIIAMNRARKMIPHMLRGYKLFRDQNPDVKSHLMLWTNVMPRKPPDDITTGVSDVGVNLMPEIMELGLNEAVIWPNWEQVEKIGGLPEYDPTGGWDMVKLYSSFDVNFLCSGGEGCGLPYLESASVGVPSVGTDYAGGAEHVGSGITVPWSNYVVVNTPGVRYVMADIDKMAEALAKICNGNKEKMARKARAFAERFDWGRIVNEYWKPFLYDCERELYPKISNGVLSSWD